MKERILAAATNVFATFGYAGASTSQIAEDADTSVPLVLYHFQSKEQLWREVVQKVASQATVRSMAEKLPETGTAVERLRTVIVWMVHACAEHPELHRLVMHEAHQSSERLSWLCETIVKDDHNHLCQLITEAQKEGGVRKINPARMRYAIIAIAALPFSVSAEYQQVTKRNPFNKFEIAHTIETINALVFL